MTKARLIRTIALACLLLPLPALAMDAGVLPKGVFILSAGFGFKQQDHNFTHSFGTATRSLVDDIDNVVIDPSIFINKDELVKMLMDLGYSEEKAREKAEAEFDAYKIGTTDATLSVSGQAIPITFGYGITDRLTFMTMFNISRLHYNADLQLRGSHVRLNDICGAATRALIPPGRCFNPDAEMGFGNLPIAPVEPDDSGNYEGVMDITGLEKFLMDPVYGFQYKPIPKGEGTEWGIDDIIIGLRYKLYQSEHWTLGYTNWMHLPTGKFLDQDKLFDTKFGDHQVDLGFLFSADFKPFGAERLGYVFHDIWIGLTAGYTIQFADTREMRVWGFLQKEDGTQSVLPLAPYENKVKLIRDYGDSYDWYLSGGTSIWDHFGLGFEFYGYYQVQDQYWGPQFNASGGELDYRANEWETNRSAIDLTVSGSFNTLKWAMEGKFIPMMLTLSYRRTLAGMNIDQIVQYGATLTFGLPILDLITGNLGNRMEELKRQQQGEGTRQEGEVTPVQPVGTETEGGEA